MIELRVEPYCSQCKKFEPVSTTTGWTCAQDDVSVVHTIVKCEHASICKEIASHISRYFGIEVKDE